MNLLLFDIFNLWYMTFFVAPMWSGVAKILSLHLASLGLYNLVSDTANVKGSSRSRCPPFMTLYRKLYWRCLTTAGKGDIPCSIRHKSLAVLLWTPNRYFIAHIHYLSTSWQLPTNPAFASIKNRRIKSSFYNLSFHTKWEVSIGI